MDYCSSCRRHLNGALVCPGCGAYAPDIAPLTTDGRVGSALAATGVPPATAAHREPAAVGARRDRPLADEAESDAGTDTAPYSLAVDVQDPSPAQQGRAARRRQLARWKKNKRRAVVVGAFALAGGGLTLATMEGHSVDRAQAAAAPDHRSTGAVEEMTPEQNPPASAPATKEPTRRASHTPAPPQQWSPAADAPRQQALAAVPRTPPPADRPDVAAHPRTAASSTPQPQDATPAAGGAAERSDAPTEQSSAPALHDSTPPSGVSRTDPALISTSPTEVCVLVVCLG